MNSIQDSNNNNLIIAKKRRADLIRQLIQYGILAAFLIYIIVYIFSPGYKEPDNCELQSDGFTAISYLGVNYFDDGSNTLIGRPRFEEHLDALSNMGFVTISQQDIIDFYEEGKALPEKALYLIFEDGRRDTATFVHSGLEDNNYMATILCYADKFEMKDNKFLSPNDIDTLVNTGYWEWGSNGYRLEYINVYDRYRNFFGHLLSDEFVAVAPYLERDYNHYLMDYIRDEDKISIETKAEMEVRIQADYDSMKYIYEKKLGKTPLLYALMHSNSDRFGNHPDVSAANEKGITENFQLNINREGYSYNTADQSQYDLTRMQPQSNWYSNHLITRISDDMGVEPVFVIGDKKEDAKWTKVAGAAEFRKDTIVLTSVSNDYGKMFLDDFALPDFILSTTLKGNIAGSAGIGFRSDETMDNATQVIIENNWLYVKQTKNTITKDIYKLNLFEFDGGSDQTLEENEKESMLTYADTVLQYSKDYMKIQEAHNVLTDWEEKEVATLGDSEAENYVPDIDLNQRAERILKIEVQGENLSVWIDDKLAVRNLNIGSSTKHNKLYLQSSCLFQDKYSQRNLTDDIYDGVFYNLEILNGKELIYEYKLSTLEITLDWFRKGFESIVSFFMNTF